jgi:hypothetical protein
MKPLHVCSSPTLSQNATLASRSRGALAYTDQGTLALESLAGKTYPWSPELYTLLGPTRMLLPSRFCLFLSN